MNSRYHLSINRAESQTREFKIRCILDPFIRGNGSVYIHGIPAKNADFINIVVKDYTPSDSQSYFKTSVDGYEGSFIETWDISDKNNWVLRKLIFHIYRRPTSPYDDPEEYLFLHLEPNAKEDEMGGVYRISPHIHMKMLQTRDDEEISRLSKSHIAINHLSLALLYADINTYTNTLGSIIAMLYYEFFDRFCRN